VPPLTADFMGRIMMHEPVLLNEVLVWLNPRPGGRFIDCTAGYGGHAEAILERIGDKGRLLAVDRDPDAVLAAKERLERFGKSFFIACDNYRNLAHVAARAGISAADGILIDCGLSSVQIESAARGFSFQSEGPLDMRMDPSQPWKLSDFLARATESELADTLNEFGEERYARRIAHVIKKNIARIHSTRDLAQIVSSSVPPAYRFGRIHPATRTFQALRIKVNDELASLEEALEAGLGILAPGGRMAVISFHSLEDRIVKHFFRNAERVRGLGKALMKRPLEATEDEIRSNPRSRSAKLRVFERRAAE